MKWLGVPPASTLKRGDQVELAGAVIVGLQSIGRIGFAAGRVWIYSASSGVWSSLSDATLENYVSGFAGFVVAQQGRTNELKLSHAMIRGVIAILRSRLESGCPIDFAKAVPGVAFANCFAKVDEGTWTIESHSPDHLATSGFDFPYDQNAPSTRFQRFLAELFSDVSHGVASERIATIQQFFGASLLGQATRYQKCLVLHGTGNNGKSTLLDVLAAAFPHERVCTLQPQQFGDRFRTALLRGALLNVVNELAEAEIVASTCFKSVVAGESITAEEKNHPPFFFRPIAGHVFLANNLPPVKDRSEGFWRRLLVVGLTANTSSLPNRRPGISREIIDAEIPGIVNWLLLGAAAAQRNRKIAVSSFDKALLEQWRADSDSVGSFVQEECAPVGQTDSSDLYAGYRRWAQDSGFKPVSVKVFRQRLTDLNVAHGRSSRSRWFALTRVNRRFP